MRTCALLLAATVAAAAFASMCLPTEAMTEIPPPKTTVSGTCQAAHGADSRVNATFCTARLLKEPSAIDADTRGLAKAAAAAGIRNADAARSEAGTALRRRGQGDEHEEDPIYSAMLENCGVVYGMIREYYEAAREAIAEQKYGDVERALSRVPSLGHSCNSVLAMAPGRAGASTFAKYSEDNTQIALLTLAITSLIK